MKSHRIFATLLSLFALVSTDRQRAQAQTVLSTDPGTYVITKSGAAVTESGGSFHAAQTQLSGDGQVFLRILSLQSADPWARVSLMVRDSLSTNSARSEEHTSELQSPCNLV